MKSDPVRFGFAETSLGGVFAAASDQGLCALFLGNSPDPLICALRQHFPNAAPAAGGDADFESIKTRVIRLIENPAAERELTFPLDIRGTAFQQTVWQALREIPLGQTASYAEIACRINAPRAVRAVAGACGANLIAVVIPCHRVVRSDGSLSGYRWGVEYKRALLEREAASGFEEQ